MERIHPAEPASLRTGRSGVHIGRRTLKTYAIEVRRGYNITICVRKLVCSS